MRAACTKKRPWLFKLGPLLAMCFCASPAMALNEYRVKESANKLEVTTPYGQRVYQGKFRLDAMKHYKVGIPLKDLLPPAAAELRTKLNMDVAKADRQDEDDEEEKSLASSKVPGDPTADLKDKEGNPTEHRYYLPEGERNPSSTFGGRKGESYDDSDRLVMEANHLYNRKRFFDALYVVEELLRRRPTLTRAWIMKGSLLYVQGHKDLARKAWEKAQEIDPQSDYIKDLFARYR